MAPNWGLFSVWDTMKREPASRYASYDQLWFSR
jgi:hypothetical protein